MSTRRCALLAATAALLATSLACAQMPPAPPPPDQVAAAAAPPTTLTGRLQRWLLNPGGDVDGLLLDDGTQVAFPPHLSAAVTQAMKPGDNVQVSGRRGGNAPVVRASTITNLASGVNVTDAPPSIALPPRAPTGLAAMTASGHIARVLYSDRGDANGVLLDSGDLVRFAPHAGAGMGTLLQPGAALYARGWGTRNAYGSALEATALGSSAQTAQDVFGGPRPSIAPAAGNS